jgi:arginase
MNRARQQRASEPSARAGDRGPRAGGGHAAPNPVISVPYHLDEHLGEWPFPLTASTTIERPLPDGVSSWERMAGIYEHVARAVAKAERPVVVSGDCTTSLGVLAGLQRAGLDPATLWFDAHGDFNTDETTVTGYLGGMPAALAVGRGDATVRNRVGLRPLDERDLILVDARDLDLAERDTLERSDVRRVALEQVASTAIPARPLYVHIDFDVLDPAELPGIRLQIPVPGGPTIDDLALALRTIATTHHVAALGLACTWHPDQAGDQEAMRTVQVVLDALGFSGTPRFP